MALKDKITTILFHPVVLGSLAVILFTISFGISPYHSYVIADIWILTAGIVFLEALNIGSVNNTITQFFKNKSKIDEYVSELNRNEVALNSLSDNLTESDKKWLTDQHIDTPNALSHYIERRAKRSSTLQIAHALLGVAGVGFFTIGSGLQTAAVLQADNAASTPPSSPSPDTSLVNFPASIFTSFGYGLVYSVQIIFLILLATSSAESEAIKDKLVDYVPKPAHP